MEFLLKILMIRSCKEIALELNIKEKSFIANLTTIGRNTGKEHTVPLRLVFYNGKFYASRRNPDGDWLKNIAKNPSVKIEVNGKEIACKASIVNNEELCKKISSLKYSDERAAMERIIAEITPIG
jgi:nitroimidazol reductase NimA-like FMN-containing flavoprotein (pyridoxamine 5'-phosphate oxidase superfamily)